MTSPRRPNLYVIRSVYVAVLLVLMCTAWLVLAGTQIIRNVGDMARFGSILFQILAPLQLAVMVFLAAMVAASAVSQEKDRRTLDPVADDADEQSGAGSGQVGGQLVAGADDVGGGAAGFLAVDVVRRGVVRAGRERVRGDVDDRAGRRQSGIDDRFVARKDVSDVGDDGADPGVVDRRLGGGGRGVAGSGGGWLVCRYMAGGVESVAGHSAGVPAADRFGRRRGDVAGRSGPVSVGFVAGDFLFERDRHRLGAGLESIARSPTGPGGEQRRGQHLGHRPGGGRADGAGRSDRRRAGAIRARRCAGAVRAGQDAGGLGQSRAVARGVYVGLRPQGAGDPGDVPGVVRHGGSRFVPGAGRGRGLGRSRRLADSPRGSAVGAVLS
jgi:hypothetical protein